MTATQGLFERVRFRIGGADNAPFSATRYFVDSALVCTTAGSPPPPIVVTTGIVDNVIGLSFDSEAGKNYQLECTTDNENWTAGNFTIHGIGQTETTFDPTGSDSNKNYRIVTLP